MSKPSFNSIYAKYPFPMDKRLHVDTLANLITKEKKFFYDNMVVFITTEKSFYYKKDGVEGDSLSDWSKIENNNVKFGLYDNTIAYVIGSCVYVGDVMYICTQNTNIGEDPINTPSKWIKIQTSTYLEVSLNNESEKTITHAIERPIVSVFDSNGNEWIPYIKRNTATEMLVKLSENITGTIEIK